MQQTPRPYLTSGIAVAGAALIAVVPAAPITPDAGPQLPQLQRHAVTLTADGFFDPWTELFTNTSENLSKIASSPGWADVVTQFLSNPTESWSNLSHVVTLMTTLLPEISASFHGFPLTLGVDLPPTLSSALAAIGPWIILYNTFNDLTSKILDFSDPSAAFAALINAPAILLNAFLNGQSVINVAPGVTLPLFNGLLVAPQSFDLTTNLGELVDQAGFGSSTITDLLDQAGVGDQSIASLLSSLLDSAGLGDLTPVGLLDKFGVGQESIATLAIDLLKSAGIDNPTISDLAQQLTGGDQTIASLLAGLIPGDPTITDLLDQTGLGDETLGGLIKDALASAGFDNPTITQLVDQLGFNMNVTELITTMLGNPSMSGLLSGLLGTDHPATIGDLVTLLLGTEPGDFGAMTVKDLFDMLTDPNNNDASVGSYTLAEFVVYLLNQADPSLDWTLSEALQNLDMPLPNDPTTSIPLADMTLHQLLSGNPDFTAPDSWRALLAGIPLDANHPSLGNMTIVDLCKFAGVSVPIFGCDGIDNFPANLATGLSEGETLNDLMGHRSVVETLDNLKNVNGVALGQMTVGQLITATGEGNVKFSDILLNLQSDLHLTNTMDQILTALGLDNEHLTDILVNGWNLNNTTVEQLLDDWGLGNITLADFLNNLGLDNTTVNDLLTDLGLNTLHLNTLIDGLGFSDPDMSLNALLSDWGLDNLDVDTVLDRLLGNATVGDLLNGLDLNNVHLNDVLDALLGNTTLSSVLTNIGLDSTDLDTIISKLIPDNITVDSILSSWGLDTVTVDHILESMGLSDTDILSLHAGDFAGLWPELLNVIPQQIAAALGG